MKKAVFLDRDGTINVEKNYLYKIEEFEFLPGVIEGLKRFKMAGYLLIVLTNQSGIARGYYTENQYRILEKWMLNTLEKQRVVIDKVYYCPHLPDAEVEKYRKVCTCRKPGLGMFERAIQECKIDVSSSICVGDKMRDLALCENGITRGYLLYANDESTVSFNTKIHRVKGGILQVAEEVLGFGSEENI